MNRETQQFSAKWSFAVWIITISVGLVLSVVVYGIIKAFITGDIYSEQTQAWAFLFGAIPLIIVMIVMLLAPRKYTITEEEIIINRFGPNVIIPIQNIDEIKQTKRQKIGSTIRIFGSGGFFGGFGIFYNRQLGTFQAYITNTKTLIFIECNDKRKILISPEKPEEFLVAVEKARKIQAE